MKKIFSYFLQGVLLVAPVAIVTYIIWWLFITIDSWLTENISEIIGYRIPGLGILFLFITLTLLGFIGETTLVRPVKHFTGRIIKRIPILNLLFTSLNDLLSAFMGKEKKFNTPVKVLFNKENNLWKLGFITRESLKELGDGELAAVYFPHSYNFSGELYLVPKEKCFPVSLTPAQAMKFIVSGGVTQLNAE